MQTKNILLTGGTGFLGQALTSYWLNKGHKLTILSRDPVAAVRTLGPKVNAVGNVNLLPAAADFDAVVNLAGAPIFANRWSESRKKLLRDSRISLTEQLVAFLGHLAVKPKVLISGSAIGVYGDQGDTLLTETYSNFGKHDFSQQICIDWENTARQAEQYGIRVCLIRTGLVLDQGGGLLNNMLPAFKLGLGGQLGSGKQWMSWIHRRDWLAIVDNLLHNEDLQGAFNATAPQAVTNSEFSNCLAQALHRPLLMPLPAKVLQLILGEMAELVLGSQRVLPKRLLDNGFQFQFNTLDTALTQIFHKS